MAISIGDAVLKITGDTKDLDKSLTDAERRTKEASEKMKKYLMLAGAAFTAVGVAGLKLVDSARKMNAQLGVTALNLGITTKEMRGLALETTNVTFPLEEVIASFDFLARAGIKDTKVLKDTATAFDTLGDAIGLGASQVTEVMVPAMKTFRLSAEEIASKIDIMTYVVRNSTVSLEDFNTMVGYTDQEMVDAGFTIDDMAAAMIWMSENGIEPGRVMLREWMKAVTKSKKENISMTEALGMTSDELEIYKGKLEGVTGMTKEYADEANKQLGILDKLRQKWAELTLQYGTFLQPLEPILATMTALGPMMMLFSTVLLPSLTFKTAKAAIANQAHNVALVAKRVAYLMLHPAMIAHKIALLASIIAIKAVTVAQWLWNAALTANPIGLVVAGIAALIAIGILLWKNWDKVAAKAKEVWEGIVSFFKGVWKRITGLFSEHWDKILAILFPMVGIPILIARNWGKITEVVSEIWNKATDAVAGILDNLKRIIVDFGRNALDWLKKKFEEVIGPIKNTWEWIRNLIGRSPGVVMLGKEMEELGDKLPREEFIIFTREALLPTLSTTRMLVEWTENLKNSMLGLRDTASLVAETFVPELLASFRFVGDALLDLIKQVNAYIESLLAIPKQVTTRVTMVRGGAGGGGGAGDGKAGQIVTGGFLQKGGIAMRPMLATIAERAPEAVIPLDRGTLERLGIGGYRTANIILQVEGRTIVRAIGIPLVDEIRARTGARM